MQTKIDTQDCYTTIAMKGSGLDKTIQKMVKNDYLDKHENVFILTKEEFEKAIGDAFEAGEKREHDYLNRDYNSTPDKTEYIENLFK